MLVLLVVLVLVVTGVLRLGSVMVFAVLVLLFGVCCVPVHAVLVLLLGVG